MSDHSSNKNEGDLAWARIAELQARPVKGNFDAAHLREVHRRIFQDMPQHAPGEYRQDAPAHIKARVLEAGVHHYPVHYAPRSQVEARLDRTLFELGGPAGLQGLDTKQFSERMARLYGDLDHIHPFKEGNSRTLRSFTQQLAAEAGFELDWSASNANGLTRDRLYIARDLEVAMRSFPGLDMERANNGTRAEFDTWLRLVARYKNAPSLQQLIAQAVKARLADASEAQRAAAIEQHVQATDLTERQRQAVMTRVQQNTSLAASDRSPCNRGSGTDQLER